MPSFSLEADIKGVYNGLNATLTKSPRTTKKMLRAAAMAGRGEEKKRVYQSLNRGSGGLRRAVSFKMKSDREGVVVVRSDYAANQIFGGEVVPRNREFLAFEIDGKHIRTDRVFIPPRWDFFGEMDQFYRSGAPLEKMEQVLEKENEKLWPS